jgi:hypothetical protein
MTVFVNYYTCSYGDSFTNMFGGYPVNRQGGIATCSFDGFIQPEFYSANLSDKIYKDFLETKFDVVACHRQNKFNFEKLELPDVKVITIIVDDAVIDLLIKRFKKIHLDFRNKSLGNKLLDDMRLARPELSSQLIALDYKKWANENCLDSDIKLHLSWVNDLNKIESFCQQHNLKYNKNWIENIKLDMLQYHD